MEDRRFSIGRYSLFPYIYSILVTHSHILLSKKVSEITKDTKDTSLIYIHFYHIFDTFQQYLPQLCISLSH